MDNKFIKVLLWLGLIFLYLYLNIIIGAFIENLHINNSILKDTLYILGEVIITGVMIALYYKDFKGKFKELKSKEGSKKIASSIKIWLIGLFVMILSNAIISIFIKDIADNEAINRSIIITQAMYAFISMIILTPICEEILFRLSIKKMIDNKIIYILFSGVIFGFVHVLSAEGLQMLYIIPYTALGISFATIYEKHKNILCSILMHAIHNLICIILILFL